ncbi:sugar ABC transporter ATP-binding protein [Rhodococcus sp. T7]|uniref:sugar ABC transporter ATP-binding protein n=1 Tax=Rhodococcus sp. T7 TaxID=627444 RepID=UPI001357EB2A|nr:sugar ABC transporter ATP-binding protein [Rhodococcus sp. T7]KAF0960252.1 Ribose import ATP-binding protein RbsA [Rhodococcus sp. T7]
MAQHGSLHPQPGEEPGPVAPEVGIRVRSLTKTFGGTHALRDVSFDITRGSIHALCGGNGSGKSTLIKILAGVHHADSGMIEIDGRSHDAAKTSPSWAHRHGLHFVHQASATFAELTVAENFAIGSSFGGRALSPIRWRALRLHVQRVLDRFELNVAATTRMGDLSPATQTMVSVARALQNEAEADRGALILDEPTASLPAHEATAVLDAMRRYTERGHTVVFVSHRLGELLEVADEMTFLRDGRHLETRTARGLNTRSLIEKISGHAPSATPARRVESVQGQERLRLENYAVGPLRDVTMSVRAGEIVGISGLLGSGRSTLLKSLFGVHPATGGTASLDGKPLTADHPVQAIRRGVAYLPEDRAGQAGFNDLTVRENLSAPAIENYWRGLRIRRSAERDDAQMAIELYDVVTSSAEAVFSSMSGGNQQKVVLARWLALHPLLLLLDEPTQGVDIGARNAIHDRIREAARNGTSVLVVSSDPQELSELCDRVIGLWNGTVQGEARAEELSTQRCTELAYGLSTDTSLTYGTDKERA